MTNDETFHQRPILKRLDTGWLAWQATIGYISHAHSADAVLTLTAYPVSEVAVGWSASLLWGEHVEAVHNESSLAAALRGLWAKIEAHHTIFLDSEAAVRRPVDYADDAWLDEPTRTALDRLLQATTAMWESGWRIVIAYQPVDHPDQRIRASLFAQDGAALADAQGPVLREVCQSLYRSSAHYYAARDR